MGNLSKHGNKFYSGYFQSVNIEIFCDELGIFTTNCVVSCTYLLALEA